MSEQENIRIARMQFERLNRGDIGFRDEIEHKDIVIEGPGAAGPMDRDQYLAYLQGFLDPPRISNKFRTVICFFLGSVILPVTSGKKPSIF